MITGIFEVQWMKYFNYAKEQQRNYGKRHLGNVDKMSELSCSAWWVRCMYNVFFKKSLNI